MNTGLLILFLLASLLAVHCDAASNLVLVKDGKSDYVIVLSDSASPSEKHAAGELQKFVEEISGARLPISGFSQARGKRMIVIGDGQVVRSLKVKIDGKSLGNEGFVIRTVGSNLVIAGGRQRGSMYGAYTFLEEILGCRWYAPGVSYIPKKPTIIVPRLNIVQKPDFEYREPYYTDAGDADWAARNKVNGHFTRLDEARGGKVFYGRFCHTFDEIAPVDKYFKEHPEYYSLFNGERIGGQYKGQLCLTNPEVQKIATAKTLQWIEENPEATIFSVTQNDNAHYCQCERCKAVDEEEGSPSGLMLRFVNGVADEVAKKHLDKLIDTFAYWYTEKPPKITKPRPNVRIRLCPIVCCQFHPYEKCEKNAPFMDNIRKWSSITDTLYIWHYNTNFTHYLLPFPDLDQLATSIPLYKRFGVKGVFAQGIEPGGRPFMDNLKAYVLAKMLWNTKTDMKAVRDEFLNGYYRRAGRMIGQYLDLIHQKVRDDNIHGNCTDGLDRGFRFDKQGDHTLFLMPDVMARCALLLDMAEKLADNPDVLKRVKRVRLSLEYVKAVRQVQAAESGTADEKVAAIRALEDIASKCEADGVTHWAAGAGSVRQRCDEMTAPLKK